MSLGAARYRKGLLSALRPLCLAAAIMLMIALAPERGGSFSASAGPQDATASAALPQNSAFFRELSLRAEELGERFGIVLYPALGAALPVEGCAFAPCPGPAEALSALEELERTLSAYPEGFIERTASLSGGLVIELCGAISGDPGRLPEEAEALTADCGFRLIALDVSSPVSRFTVMHELCHVIDAALSEAAKEDPSHWDEAAWAALCPEGFSYYMAYADGEGVPLSVSGSPEHTAEAAPSSAYFINRYCKTYPTEDRAVLFETLIRASSEAEYFRSPALRSKLDYYFGAIRYYLAPEGGWSATPFWEEKLESLGKPERG